MAAVLALGGTFQTRGSFVAPYSNACGEPGKDLVVIGSDVNVRSARSNTAPVISTVSFAIVRGTSGITREQWAEVELAGGEKGFIAGRYVRDPVDYRAYFAKIDRSWRLTAFIAG